MLCPLPDTGCPAMSVQLSPHLLQVTLSEIPPVDTLFLPVPSSNLLHLGAEHLAPATVLHIASHCFLWVIVPYCNDSSTRTEICLSPPSPPQ
jgi:hypothetical protein